MSAGKQKISVGKVQYSIFIPAVTIVLIVSLILAFRPDLGGAGVQKALQLVYGKFTSVIFLFGAFSFAVLMWLAFGPYGNVKLGRAEDKPEFSYLTWVFMLFTSGVGIGLMIWSVVEPIYYIQGPPLGIEPMSKKAFEWAHMLPQFHWGFSAWAIYCLPTLPIAYSVFVRRENALKISTSCRPILGKKVDGPIGRIIEIIIVIGTICAVGTSLGLAIPLVSAIISTAFTIEDTMVLKIMVTGIWFVICGAALLGGLSKGLKLMSQLKMWISFGLLGFVVVFGPTSFIFDSWANSIGLLLNNFFQLAMNTEPYRLIEGDVIAGAGAGVETWPQTWTTFYWAWWIGYAPVVALFVARISKGRTIKELIVAECVWGTLGCWIFLAILGAYSLYLQGSGILDITAIQAAKSDAYACVEVFRQLPFAKLVVPFYAFLCFIFLATVINSSSYTLASICTEELAGDEQPARWQSLTWAAILCVFGIGLLVTGGEKALKTIQASTIVGALPLMPIIIIMVFSLFKALKEDLKDKQVDETVIKNNKVDLIDS